MRIHYMTDDRISYRTTCGVTGRGLTFDGTDLAREVTCRLCRKMRGLKPLTVEQERRIEQRWTRQV